MKIIAFDPGGTTGVCIFERLANTGTVEWKHGQLGPGDHHLALWSLLERERPHIIIYERFMYQRRELTEGVSLVLDSVEYIGVIKLWYDKFCAKIDPSEYIVEPTLVEQSPSQMSLWGGGKKNDDSGARLKKLSLYTPNAPHANDATRHLLYYLSVTKGDKRWFNALKPNA